MSTTRKFGCMPVGEGCFRVFYQPISSYMVRIGANEITLPYAKAQYTSIDSSGDLLSCEHALHAIDWITNGMHDNGESV